MSAPQYRIPAKVRALLRDRGLSVQALAEKTGVPHRRVLRALSGHPAATATDALNIRRFLRLDELKALGWLKPDGLIHRGTIGTVTRGTIPEKGPPNTFRNAGLFGTAQNAAQFDADLADADE